jgi:sugar lactone lactonase YvrE
MFEGKHLRPFPVATCLALLIGATQLFAQSPVNFGSVALGASTTQTVSITIPNGSTLGGSSVVTQGAANLDFTATDNTCSNGATVACTVQVQFQPTAVGTWLGAVVLTDQSNNTLATVFLSGIGTGPVVSFPPGIMSTVIGGSVAGTTAGLFYPNGVGVDAAGNVYVGDTGNNAVRKLSPSGVTTTIAGGNGQGYSGDGGPATSAKLYYPTTIRLDGAGNVYIVDDGNNAVRMINPAGIITTVAGLAPGISVCATPSDQWGDGCPATQASLDFFDSYYGEGGTATDAAGNLYIGDTAHNLIRRVSAADGTISIFAGTGAVGYSGDGGPATSALLNNPDGGAFDGAGNFYFADLYNNVIRMITPGGTISTVAGTGTYGHTGDGGPATTAELGYPYQVAVDAAGDLYVTDSGNFTEGDTNEVIRKVTPGGIITTVAGSSPSPNGNVTYSDGPALSALMWGPVDVAVDASGNLYIADDYNHAIRKVDVSAPPTLTFPTTFVGNTSSPQSVTVGNVGNETLNAIAPGLAIGPNFLQVAGSGNPADCTTSFSVPFGAACDLSISFKPQTVGPLSSTATLTDNSLNASAATQSIPLQGTAMGRQAIMFITPAPPTAATGDMFTVMATGGGSGNPVTFAVGASSVCTLSGATYTMTSNSGHCHVVVNQAGSTYYTAAPQITETVTAVKTVTRIAPKVTLTGAPHTAAYLSSFTVATTQNSGVIPTITASPSNICTVSNDVVTMIRGSGICTVKASWAFNVYYNAASLSRATTAEKLPSSVNWTSPAPISHGTTLSGVLNATASVPGSFVYKNGAATVHPSTVLAAGSYTLSVTFTPTASADYGTATASVSLTVNP